MPAEAAPSFVWVAEVPDPGGWLELPPEESHYLSRVCRARAGERVRATDGRGTVAELRLLSVGGPVRAEVLRTVRLAAPPAAWVCCGAPEGERGDWLVEKLAEFGVTGFQPVDCERAAWRTPAARMDRWHRLARAALRQSQQAWHLEVRAPIPLAALEERMLPGALRHLLDPGGGPWRGRGGGTPAVAIVGPATGLSPAERDLLMARGFRAIRVAGHRLRAETAAVAWAALWTSAGDLEQAPGAQ